MPIDNFKSAIIKAQHRPEIRKAGANVRDAKRITTEFLASKKRVEDDPDNYSAKGNYRRELEGLKRFTDYMKETAEDAQEAYRIASSVLSKI